VIADSALLSYTDSHVASNYVLNFPEYDSYNDYFIVTNSANLSCE